MFSFIKRIKERKQQEAREKAQKIKEAIDKRIEERKAIICPFLEKNAADREAEGEKRKEADLAKCNETNSKCPKCGSTSTINKFVKIQGKISGHANGFSYRGYGLGKGEIDGELDTLKVNECKDCGNQWEIQKPMHHFAIDYTADNFSPYDYGGYLGMLYRRISSILEDDEKIEDIKPRKVFECYKDTPREVLEYCLFGAAMHEWYYDEHDFILGTKMEKDEKKEGYNYDQYLFTVSDEVWEKLKALIGR